jgi:putative hemolysin
MVFDIVIILLILVLAGLYAGSEIAFVVANRLKLEIKSKKMSFFGTRALMLIQNPEKFLSISLVGTGFSHVAFSSLTTILLSETFGFDGVTILFCNTLIILFFAEIIPKSFFRENADSFIPFFTVFLIVGNFLLYPLIIIVQNAAQMIARLLRVPLTPEQYVHSKEDILGVISEIENAGRMKEESGEYFKKAFELKEVPVSELMIHRTDIRAVPNDISIEKLHENFIDSKHSRIFVYDRSIDNIQGVVNIIDMFGDPLNIKSITRDVSFVPETKKSTELLQEFITSGQSIAVVVDEFGGMCGIVTLEDIIEEVVGEIEGEYDEEKTEHKKINETTFIFNGRVEIDVMNEIYGLNLPAESYMTIGGLVSGIAGEIPKKNEIVFFKMYKFVVLQSSSTNVEIVKLEILPDNG